MKKDFRKSSRIKELTQQHHKYIESNKNGRKLKKLTLEKYLGIATTSFEHPEIHKKHNTKKHNEFKETVAKRVKVTEKMLKHNT